LSVVNQGGTVDDIVYSTVTEDGTVLTHSEAPPAEPEPEGDDGDEGGDEE
jgi:hypothetical protein